MRFSVVAVVFLVLVTVFSAYAVVWAQGLPTESQSTVTVGTYSLQGSYSYAAALSPNLVYNTTTLEMGQGTLFVAITKTINVTYTGTVSLNQQGSVSLDTSYLVTLSGGAWSTTLSHVVQVAQRNSTDSAVYSKSFLLNVTQVVALAKEIGAELQYSSPSYLIQIRPAATGSLVESGRTVPLNFVAPLNLTLSNGVITPSGTTYSSQGNVTGEVMVPRNVTYTYRYASYGLLSGSLVLLGVSMFFALRKEQISEEDNLAKMTQPYREVIAATTTLPRSESQVPMEKWEDLVKVADTLGKPILEFDQEEAGETRHAFCVLDGETRYYYEFRPLRPEANDEEQPKSDQSPAP